LSFDSADSARARLIKTRRGTWIDESLLPAVHRECLDILREAAREAVGEDTHLPGVISDVLGAMNFRADMFRSEWMEQNPPKPVPKDPVRKEIDDTIEILHSRGGFEGLNLDQALDFYKFIAESIRAKHAPQEGQETETAPTKEPRPQGLPNPFTDRIILDLLLDVLHDCGVLDAITWLDFVRCPDEELEAQDLARAARKTTKWCGGCGRELPTSEPAYFGANVYVGMWPLYWDRVSKPQLCKSRYERTVLCESCAPQWLSPTRDDVVTQLCAHCERPMVMRLKPSELGRTFCSRPCQQTYHNQLRKEKRTEERTRVCEVCGEQFVARRDAKTCSPKCKQKAYRRRKREVKESR
jgi:hypothetical protein